MTSSELPATNDDSEPTTEIFPPQQPDPGDLRLAFGSRSDVGKVRANNEDAYLIARVSKSLDVLATSLTPEQGPDLTRREGHVFLVADGMGGCAAGERASATVVSEAARHLMETAKWFFKLDDPDEDVRLRLLQETLERVDRRLVEEGQADRSLTGMGTTLTALSILGTAAFIVQVGDSRAYLFRQGALQQLTHDETLAQKYVDQGLLMPEEARNSRLRHVLTNAIGGRLGVTGQVGKLRLAEGDRLLLCTDGLNDGVPDERIAEILARQRNPEETCQALVESALSGGGRDNITVIVVDCSNPEAHRSAQD